jgi:predicted membrane channel-forming protein YqfA (hemolysin III family)
MFFMDDILFYIFAVLFMVIASETYTRSGATLSRSAQTSSWYSLYSLLGSVVAPLLVVALFVWGFIAYGWWIALLVVIGISYVVSMAYAERMWHGAIYLVLGAVPLGMACAAYAIAQRHGL